MGEWALKGLRLVCIPLGALILVLGIIAGYANHVLLDGPTFATKVDAVRQADSVSQALGRSLTDQYVAAEPDAAALRPLVQAVATSTVGSDILSRPTRAAAESFQRAATQPNAKVLALRVADAGAVLTSVLQKSLPSTTASDKSASISLDLARFGGQTWSARTIRAAQHLRLAAWLLPALGLILIAVGLLLSPHRRRGFLAAGIAVLSVTSLAALTLLIADQVAAHQDTTTLTGALIAAGWVEFAHPLWWWLAALGLLALMVIASAGSLLPEFDPAAVVRRGWRLIAHRPDRLWLALGRALAFLLIGGAILTEPSSAATALAVIAGAGLLLYGLAELARATNDEQLSLRRKQIRAPRGRLRTRPVRARPVLAVGAVTALALAGYAVWLGGSTQAGVVETGPIAGSGQVCDGYAALCSRPFTDVAFAASHNSMSVATEPGWYLGEQGEPIVAQLDDGIRALLIDVWPGQPRRVGGVATAEGSYAEARAQAVKEYGEATVDAGLRVFHTLADPAPSGPPALYLCHGLCELGATAFGPEMQSVKRWLDANPDQTLTIIIEAHAPTADIGAALVASGLAAYAYQPVVGQPWPTLHAMITSGHRLVVMTESDPPVPQYPWLVDGYRDFLQETPYTFAAAKDFSCRPNRGSTDAPLFLVNHWLSGFARLVSDAQAVNTQAVLGARVEQCQAQRQLPNFVAVNHADLGDLQAVVRRLNGMP